MSDVDIINFETKPNQPQEKLDVEIGDRIFNKEEKSKELKVNISGEYTGYSSIKIEDVQKRLNDGKFVNLRIKNLKVPDILDIQIPSKLYECDNRLIKPPLSYIFPIIIIILLIIISILGYLYMKK